MNDRIDKLRGHTDRLLDVHSAAAQLFAILKALVARPPKAQSTTSRAREKGVAILQYTLFLDCVHDLVVLTFDRDERTPSVSKIVDALKDDVVVGRLRQDYSLFVGPPLDEPDRELEQIRQQLDEERRQERALEFDEIMARVLSGWSSLLEQAYVRSFSTIRDKMTAHFEVRRTANGFEFVRPSTDVTMSDLTDAYRRVQGLVDDLNRIVRGAGFMFEDALKQFDEVGRALWERTSIESGTGGDF